MTSLKPDCTLKNALYIAAAVDRPVLSCKECNDGVVPESNSFTFFVRAVTVFTAIFIAVIPRYFLIDWCLLRIGIKWIVVIIGSVYSIVAWLLCAVGVAWIFLRFGKNWRPAKGGDAK